MFFVLPIWSQLSANVRTAAAADRAQLRDATAAAARPGRLGVDNAAANLEIPRDKIIAANKIKKIINTCLGTMFLSKLSLGDRGQLREVRGDISQLSADMRNY